MVGNARSAVPPNMNSEVFTTLCFCLFLLSTFPVLPTREEHDSTHQTQDCQLYGANHPLPPLINNPGAYEQHVLSHRSKANHHLTRGSNRRRLDILQEMVKPLQAFRQIQISKECRDQTTTEESRVIFVQDFNLSILERCLFFFPLQRIPQRLNLL